MSSDFVVLGRGVYTPRQAARLVGTTAQEVLRWTRGSGPRDPLWHAYYQSLEDSTELSFLDLIELRVVRAFRNAGVSLQSIRFAMAYATEVFQVARPLATMQFKTDGKTIFLEALDREGHLVSLKKANAGQKVFAEIIKQSLNDVEFENGTAVRWRPTKHEAVVIDPARAFGDPILDKHGISTQTLAKEFEIFGSEAYLSKIYEIPKPDIRRALKFEGSLAA